MNYILIDNFFEDPDKEREIALSSEYKTIEHNNLNYRGISLQDAPLDFAKIASTVGVEDFVEKECFYRQYPEGYESETFIHSDVLIGTVSAIAFLTRPEHCKGGLAFWRHKGLGWDRHPTADASQALGIQTDDVFDYVYKCGLNENEWEMTDYVPMAYNRCIIFDSTQYHSRYPIEPIGQTIEDCRLIKVFFGKV